MSNRRRREQRLTVHKRAWYRRSPGQIVTAAEAAVRGHLPGRRPVAVAAVVIVAGAGAAVGLTAGLAGSGPHPVAFRIVFRVEDGTSTPHTITTQVLDVRRPFYAASLTRSGQPPGTALTGGSVEHRTYVQVSSDQGRLKAQMLQPDIASAPGADLRLQPALEAAAKAGLVTSGGTDTVAGRECVEYESHDSLDAGNWKPPTKSSNVTSCVDADGHLLRDIWLIHGKLVRSRTAVSFVTDPKPLADPLAGIAVDTATSPLGVTSAPLSSKTSFATAIPSPPSGFRRVDARLVGFTDPQTQSLRTVARDLLYSDGDDVISVREQRSLGAPPSPSIGPTVVLPAFGTGHWSFTPQGLAITVAVDQSTELRVLGTVSQDALLRFARTIGRAAPTPTASASP
jgi:hypothetical protein